MIAVECFYQLCVAGVEVEDACILNFSVIKVWDLRKNYTMYRQDPVPFKSFCYPGISTRKLGKQLNDVTPQTQVDLKNDVKEDGLEGIHVLCQ